MSPADVVKEFDQLASRFAFRAASVHGVLWPAAGVVVLAVGAQGNQPPAGLALVLVALGGLPAVLLVRGSQKALGVAGAVYWVGVVAVLFGDAALAIVAGTVGMVGPSAVATASAWRLTKGGEAWARGGVVCAAAAVAVPLVVLALAAAGGHGLTGGLMDMGEGMGVSDPHPPTAPCIRNCGIQGPTIEPLWMPQLAAPLAAALGGSALCAIAALLVTRERLPRAVAER